MINVLRAKPEYFQSDVVQGRDFWHVYNSIPIKENEDINNMKFSAVVGNPPYQISSDANNRNTPIYHYFYEAAESVSRLYSLISPARFLFNAGLTPPDWNEKMLNDKHVRVVKYMQDSKECFPTVDIKGGIAIILRNVKENYGAIKRFVPNEVLQKIASKFNPKSTYSISTIVFSGRADLKFNDVFLNNSIEDRLLFIQTKRPSVKQLSPNEEYELKSSSFDALPYVFEDSVFNKSDYYHILGLKNSKRVWKYIKRSYMTPRYLDGNNIEKFKVFVPESNGSGVLKLTQHNPQSVWAYVPLQDFTSTSDIDWSQSIADIDRQLYAKYGLTDEEIAFIEKMIKPME